MKNLLRTSLAMFILIAACSFPAFAETIHCTECGMVVDTNSKFVAKIVQGDTIRYFCDIGDLFSYLRRKVVKNVQVGVRDYGTGEWFDAGKAYYVHNTKKFMTPMGWGIAAFKDKQNASKFGSPTDFDATVKALK
jgi:nitrous oxide reductase accessory protein NosL